MAGTILLLVAGPALLLHITFGMDSHPQYSLGKTQLRYGDYVGINYLGRMSPVDVGFDIESVVFELYQNLSGLPVSSIFVLNPFGMVSDATLAELNVRSILEGKKRFFKVSCFHFDFEDRRTFWENSSICRSRLSSADYVIAEGVASHEWWLQDMHMYEGGVIPTTEFLKAKLGNYEVRSVLRNPLGPNPETLYPTQSLHQSLYWLNESAIILRKI